MTVSSTSNSARDWSYSSTCNVYLPLTGLPRQDGLPTRASVRCYDTKGRYLCLCVDKTLLEFDLETATCLREIQTGEEVFSVRYLDQKPGSGWGRQVVGFDKSGYIKVYDLVRATVTKVAFALKKNQTVDEISQDGAFTGASALRLAPSSSHAGVFWSAGKSQSVYWISLKHSQEVKVEKQHVPTIEDAFRIKSSEAKSAVVALACSHQSPLLAVGRAAGVVEVYNTATFKLIERVQLNAQNMVCMEVIDLGSNLSVCSLSRVNESEYHLHQLELAFSEGGSYASAARVLARDPVRSVDARLVGKNPKLLHLKGSEVALFNEDAGTVVRVRVGEGASGCSQKVTRLGSLLINKEECGGNPAGSAMVGQRGPGASQFVGISPDTETVFVCTKSTGEHFVCMNLHVYESISRMKRESQMDHCTSCVELGPTQQEDKFSNKRVEAFKVAVLNYSSEYQSLRVVLTETALDRNGSKTSFRVEHKLPPSLKMDSVRLERVFKMKGEDSGGKDGKACWILQCTGKLVLLVTKRDKSLAVEHFLGTSCGFVEGRRQGQVGEGPGNGVSFTILNGNLLELHEKVVGGEETSASSLISCHHLSLMAQPLRLLLCRFTSDDGSFESAWATDSKVFFGRATPSSKDIEVIHAWSLSSKFEGILDAAHFRLRGAGDELSALRLALLTDRRIILLDEELSVLNQISFQENERHSVSIHWLDLSQTLVCMGRNKVVLKLCREDGFSSVRSVFSLDRSPSHGASETFKGLSCSGQDGDNVLYFEHPIQGLQDSKVMAYALPAEDDPTRKSRPLLAAQMARDLKPRMKVTSSKISFSVEALDLFCHAQVAPAEGEEDHISHCLGRLMSQPWQVDLRYDNDPAQSISSEEKELLSVLLNLIAASGDEGVLQSLLGEEGGGGEGDLAANAANPYLAGLCAPVIPARQLRRSPGSTSQHKTSLVAENLTQSPAPSLMDSHAATPTPAETSLRETSPDMPVAAEESVPETQAAASGFGSSNWSDSDEESDDSSSSSGSSFAKKKKKIMISIKPAGASSGRPQGSATLLKSAIANLTLDSPPLMDLRTPAHEKQATINLVPQQGGPSPTTIPQPQFEAETPTHEKQAKVDLAPQHGGPSPIPRQQSSHAERDDEVVEEEEASDGSRRQAQEAFTSSSESSSDDDESGGFVTRKKFNIKIKPAAEAAPSKPSNANDIKNMLQGLRSSIEGPLAGMEPPAPPKAEAASAPPSRDDVSQESASTFQAGMKHLQSRQWQGAIEMFDQALGIMSHDFESLKSQWFVVVHHRVLAAIMQKCESLHQLSDPKVVKVRRRNLLLCARRLRLQSFLGIQVNLSAAQALITTQEYKTSLALLDGILRVLPRYANMASMTPKVKQMRDLCMVKIDESTETEESPYLAQISDHLSKVQSADLLESVLQNVFAQATA
ncbi:hypothetical protein HOP50_04g28850 [Chloropicon primus]|uniref:Uncharacterized protein n=1 Tax=Chloropicon primus TaxID=1764295 RepID=A0A5B8MIA5_9CHLO|nr:hypothetical protein A3770_04p28860 [Chloropicon primus]UPQ99577.1 hypothetical protein HOP50_04g28850 [Chloropicon primus]|eukprot:QDZ20368.1 hypothetical protein A3770_04p28860 [Chloropicon primus]